MNSSPRIRGGFACSTSLSGANVLSSTLSIVSFFRTMFSNDFWNTSLYKTRTSNLLFSSWDVQTARGQHEDDMRAAWRLQEDDMRSVWEEIITFARIHGSNFGFQSSCTEMLDINFFLQVHVRWWKILRGVLKPIYKCNLNLKLRLQQNLCRIKNCNFKFNSSISLPLSVSLSLSLSLSLLWFCHLQ